MSDESEIFRVVRGLCERARAASRTLGAAPRTAKDSALDSLAARLRREAPAILKANREDLARFGDRPTALSTAAFVDRLTLNDKRVESVARAVEEIARADDPVGSVSGMTRRPNGLQVGRVRVPL